jgi:hypothetical protein
VNRVRALVLVAIALVAVALLAGARYAPSALLDDARVTPPSDGAKFRKLTGFPSHWWYGGHGIWGGLAPGYAPLGTWWAGERGNKVLWDRLVTCSRRRGCGE